MPITDVLMGLGGFNVTLDPSTPTEIRDIWEIETSANHQQHVYVTAGKVLPADFCTLSSADLAANVLANSLFTGRIDHLTRGGPGEPFTIQGPSILAWMGDANGKGQPISGTASGAPASLLSRIGSNVLAALPASNAGFDVSLHWTSASIGVTVTDDVDEEASQRSNLDRLRVLGGNAAGTVPLAVEYYAAPDGTLHLFNHGDYSWFRGDSRFIIGPGLVQDEHDNSSGTTPVYRIVQGDIKVDEDWSDWAGRINSRDTAGNSQQYARGGPRTFDGVHTTQSPSVWLSQIQGSVGADELTFQAANLAVTQYTTKYRYTITLDPADALRFVSEVSAGARIYVYDPNRAQSDTATSIMVNGRQTGCILLRVDSMTYPLADGLDGLHLTVVRTSDGSLTAADLTTYIDQSREPRTVQIQVGERARTVTGIVRGT